VARHCTPLIGANEARLELLTAVERFGLEGDARAVGARAIHHGAWPFGQQPGAPIVIAVVMGLQPPRSNSSRAAAASGITAGATRDPHHPDSCLQQRTRKFVVSTAIRATITATSTGHISGPARIRLDHIVREVQLRL